MLKHYVEFLLPGAFFPEDETREVANRIPAHLSKIPESTYALSFFDVEEQETESGEVLHGRAKNRSLTIFFGRVYTPSQIAKLEGKDSILYRNVVGNGFRHGIKCVAGNWQAFNKPDIALGSYKELTTMTTPLEERLPRIPSEE